MPDEAPLSPSKEPSEGPSVAASDKMQAYFKDLMAACDAEYAIAREARSKGLDPAFDVEIPVAEDLASRVEKLVGPEGIAEKIRAKSDLGNRELIALVVAGEIAESMRDAPPAEAMDQAVRTGLAIVTEGVLVAPLEGIAEVKVRDNIGGGQYADVYFAGPIRSAGGTGQAISVLIADVVRRALGLAKYEPSPQEVERYKEEFGLYRNLQYKPSNDEIDLIIKACPICVNGEGTEKDEVAGGRDLPRVPTNQVRGGMCLVIAEGLCQKAAKIKKHVDKLEIEGWEFIDIFLNKGKSDGGDEEEEQEETKECTILDSDYTYNEAPPNSVEPKTKFIKDLIAGRPVFGHPSRAGGFRLRYGRGRTTGLAATAVHPAAMVVADDFMAIGTQIKIERPGKAGAITPADSIDGPIVQLRNGDIIQVHNKEIAKEIRPVVARILDMGEILIPYGEFAENNHLLIPSSFSKDWWWRLLAKAVNGSEGADAILQLNLEDAFPSPAHALELSQKYKVPFCPDYNLFFHDLTTQRLLALREYIMKNGNYEVNQGAHVKSLVSMKLDLPKVLSYPLTNAMTRVPIEAEYDEKLVLPFDEYIHNTLAALGVTMKVRKKEMIITRYAFTLVRCLGLDNSLNAVVDPEGIDVPECAGDTPADRKECFDVMRWVSHMAGIVVLPRASVRVGARMGRPEKADKRTMRPPVHSLFPIADYGGDSRLLNKAAEYGKIPVELGKRKCTRCGSMVFMMKCRHCGSRTEPFHSDPALHKEEKSEMGTWTMPIRDVIAEAKEKLALGTNPNVKAVKGLMSKNKIAEPLEKGILRAYHNVNVFKDGTARFDMTDITLTHFRSAEIGTSVDKLIEMGYDTDVFGEPLTRDDQILELKPQDIVVSKSCGDYMVNIAKFIDDLLVKYYDLPKHYNAHNRSDLVGALTIGLAPHTSGGVLCRMIGYTNAAVGYGHPFFHAAKRRNCLPRETRVLLQDGSMERLDNLFEECEGMAKVSDALGTIEKKMDDCTVLSIDRETGQMLPSKVESVMKIPSPSTLLQFKTQAGRVVKVSPYHPMLVSHDGSSIVKKRAVEVKVGDHILSPNTIDIDENDVDQIDLLMELGKLKVPDIMVHGVKDIFYQILMEHGGYPAVSQRLGMNKKTLSNFVYRDSIPLAILVQVLILDGKDISCIHHDIKLSTKRDTVHIPRMVPVDDLFCRMVGYYLAEGYCRHETGSFYQVSMFSSEEDILEDMKLCIESSLGVDVRPKDGVITVSSRIVHLLFDRILDAGCRAGDKHIPRRMRSLPLDKMKHILSAYIAGDGSVEKGRLTVKLTSKSRNLLNEVDLQLRRFGIYSTYKTDERKGGGKVREFYAKKGQEVPTFIGHNLVVRSTNARILLDQVGISSSRKLDELTRSAQKERAPRYKRFKDHPLERITSIEPVHSTDMYIYDLEVEGAHSFITNEMVLASNCDGDEDAVMLLMDGLLNFSRHFIPDKRGGLMDAPLVLTVRLDPNEIDKEAQNVDCRWDYPLRFYNDGLCFTNPKNAEEYMDLVAGRIGTPAQYEGFGFTHDTNDIAEGPHISAYKVLGSMEDKLNAQLELARKLEAVDESDVATRVIANHFLPDMIGNLRSFSRQEVRCVKCGAKYRRMPLRGYCTNTRGKSVNGNGVCGNKLTMTVSEGAVKKYLNLSKDVSVKYGIDHYIYQRVLLMERSINSIFDNDKVRKCRLDEFF